MKNIFKSLVFLILLLMIMLWGCTNGEEEDIYEGFEFARQGNEYAVSSYTGSGEVHIPDTYMDLPITSISNDAFYRSSARKVYLGNNIKTIGNRAFSNCENLVYVFISSSVTAIGENIFSESHSLFEIEVDEENSKFKSIDGNLFSKDGSSFVAYCAGKGDEELTVPEGVESLRAYLFYFNPYIKDIYLPATLSEVGEIAFYGSTIENFHVDENNSVFSADQGILYKEDTLYAFPPKKDIEQFEIPSNIKIIYDDAFSYSQVKTLFINQGTTEIGQRAFLSSKLMDITIPASVNKIDKRAFQECQELINISVADENESYQDIAGGALFSADKKLMLAYCLGQEDTSYNIPDGVEELGDALFFASHYLEEIILPSSVKKIGEQSLNAPELNSIIFNSDIPPEMILNAISGSSIIYVPDGKADIYKNYDSVWEQYANSVQEISQR